MSEAARDRKSRRPHLWIAGLAAFGLLIGFLYRPTGTRPEQTLRSSLRTSPDGVAALARGIDRLGPSVAPRSTPLVDADPVRGTVVLLAPAVSPTPREVGALLDHVRAGGAVLYAAPRLAQAPGDTAQTPLMDSLGVFSRPRSAGEDFLDMTLDTEWVDHALTDGLGAPEPSNHAVRFRSDPESAARVRPLLRAPRVPAHSSGARWMAAAELRLGDGRLLVLADAAPLANQAAADNPLAVLAVRAALAWTHPSDTVFFAEYHQGLGGDRSRAQVLADFLLGGPWGRTSLQALLVGLLALACLGVRFGSPVPLVAPPDRERRSPLEHVAALGDLYRRAGAVSTARVLLVARLARAARQPTPRTDAEAEALLRRLDNGAGPARSGAPSGTSAPLSTDAAGRHADRTTPLGRAIMAFRSDPPELARLATEIDEHLKGR